MIQTGADSDSLLLNSDNNTLQPATKYMSTAVQEIAKEENTSMPESACAVQTFAYEISVLFS